MLDWRNILNWNLDMPSQDFDGIKFTSPKNSVEDPLYDSPTNSNFFSSYVLPSISHNYDIKTFKNSGLYRILKEIEAAGPDGIELTGNYDISSTFFEKLKDAFYSGLIQLQNNKVTLSEKGKEFFNKIHEQFNTTLTQHKQSAKFLKQILNKIYKYLDTSDVTFYLDFYDRPQVDPTFSRRLYIAKVSDKFIDYIDRLNEQLKTDYNVSLDSIVRAQYWGKTSSMELSAKLAIYIIYFYLCHLTASRNARAKKIVDIVKDKYNLEMIQLEITPYIEVIVHRNQIAIEKK